MSFFCIKFILDAVRSKFLWDVNLDKNTHISIDMGTICIPFPFDQIFIECASVNSIRSDAIQMGTHQPCKKPPNGAHMRFKRCTIINNAVSFHPDRCSARIPEKEMMCDTATTHNTGSRKYHRCNETDRCNPSGLFQGFRLGPASTTTM